MAETVLTVVLIGVVLLAAGLAAYAIYRLWGRGRSTAKPTDSGA